MANLSLFGEFDGIEMGVFEDGTPFLTGKGLAFLSGVEPESIRQIGLGSTSDDEKGRAGKISTLLQQIGYDSNELYRRITIDGKEMNAYPEPVCLAVIRYYADEAGKRCTSKAKEVVWIFFQKTFREFVYALTGYNTKQLTFSQYTLSRITNHHQIAPDQISLPDGYFCLFDKMIEILQKFDLRIGYQLGQDWYDTRKNGKRFLEPDISLGIHFSSLFTSDFEEADRKYNEEYNLRFNNSKITKEKFWTQKLIKLKWIRDRLSAEKFLRDKYIGLNTAIDRRYYDFKPSPDSDRPERLPSAYCYSNDYTSLFYEWLRDVFFKYIWRDYILERDADGWGKRYKSFLLLEPQKREQILQTSEGKMISGFEFREVWERQLSSGD
jgi:hypothetical protein